MRILVTGSNGQLGRSLRRAFAGDPDITAQYTDYDTLDITDAEAVAAYLESNPADIIINCAAYTAVDRAESDPETARRLNALAPGILGKAATKAGARIIHVSTDYVFNGENFKPYTELDEADPKSVYGRTKLEGESMVKAANHDAVVIRTAWLYSEFGNNFVKTMLRLGAERKEISVVADQIGTPTYAQDLADAIHAIVKIPNGAPVCIISPTRAWPPGTTSPWKYSASPATPTSRSIPSTPHNIPHPHVAPTIPCWPKIRSSPCTASGFRTGAIR